MNLREYIEANGLSPTKFAKQIGVPTSTITRVIAGHRDPGLDLLRKIHVATEGAVTPNDFLAPVDSGVASNPRPVVQTEPAQ